MNTLPPNYPSATESLREFHERILGGYAPELVDKAVTYLRDLWKDEPQLVLDLRGAIHASPESWASPYHHMWGMAVRNKLREGGFGEDYWPIWNLDDIYVPLVERAVQ